MTYGVQNESFSLWLDFREISGCGGVSWGSSTVLRTLHMHLDQSSLYVSNKEKKTKIAPKNKVDGGFMWRYH